MQTYSKLPLLLVEPDMGMVPEPLRQPNTPAQRAPVVHRVLPVVQFRVEIEGDEDMLGGRVAGGDGEAERLFGRGRGWKETSEGGNMRETDGEFLDEVCREKDEENVYISIF